MVKDRNRIAIESLYEGVAKVSTNEVVNQEGRSVDKWIDLYTDVPCRLSFQAVQTAKAGEVANIVQSNVKLFCAPDYEIPAGSRIQVLQNGRTFKFCASGEPAFYSTHQEIPLRKEEDSYA